MIRINLNDHVKFILTEECPRFVKYLLEPNIDSRTGECILPLWEFCRIFGPHFYNGSQLIKSNVLVIGDRNELV